MYLRLESRDLIPNRFCTAVLPAITMRIEIANIFPCNIKSYFWLQNEVILEFYYPIVLLVLQYSGDIFWTYWYKKEKKSLVLSPMVIVSASEKQLNMQCFSELLSFECDIGFNLTSWIALLLWYVPSMMEVLNNISLHCP